MFILYAFDQFDDCDAPIASAIQGRFSTRPEAEAEAETSEWQPAPDPCTVILYGDDGSADCPYEPAGDGWFQYTIPGAIATAEAHGYYCVIAEG